MILSILVIVSHISLASAVTIHILLTKRDPSVATGWIGAAWLMPWIGLPLYCLLGVNRIKRKARKMVLDKGGNDIEEALPLFGQAPLLEGEEAAFAPLSYMLDKITSRPLMGGNEIIMHHDGDRLYPLMIEAIEKATSSICLCSYIFRYDEIGKKFIAALQKAHQRGVEVRVLVDGIGSGYFRCKLEAELRKAGIPAARFMHSFKIWRMPLINLRNHRKILILDGKSGFMGGLNIGAENILSRPVPHFLSVSDTHFYISGPLIGQLTEAFVRDWQFTTGELLEGVRYFPQQELKGTVKARIVTSGPDEDIEKIEYTILQALCLARRHICLMTPYFIPDMRFATQLRLAARRGVKVEIILPAQSNHAFTDAARNACLGRLLDGGCHIYFSNPPFNHSKLMVIDGIWVFAGSANLDARSLRLNFEINFEAYEKELASALLLFMKEHAHHLLTKEESETWSLGRRLYHAIACLFSPYL